MDSEYFIRLMADDAQRIALLARGVSPEQARWKPDSDSWSILEVVNHLADEEREDFRTRLDLILHHPEEDWPPIDPRGWVTARAYNERDLAESLERYLEERRYSLAWLESLGEIDWERARASPLGTMRAGDMFTSWATHDQLHLRQLVELHRAYTEKQAEPYDIGYAGPW